MRLRAAGGGAGAVPRGAHTLLTAPPRKIMDGFEKIVYQAMGEHGAAGGAPPVSARPALAPGRRVLGCPGSDLAPVALGSRHHPFLRDLCCRVHIHPWAGSITFLSGPSGTWQPELPLPPPVVPSSPCAPVPLLSAICVCVWRLPPNTLCLLFSSQEEAQKQKELDKAEIQKVLKEKDQVTADLSSMEKSFSDLFKRFEKQKEVIEGYRTVGGAALCPYLPECPSGPSHRAPGRAFPCAGLLGQCHRQAWGCRLPGRHRARGQRGPEAGTPWARGVPRASRCLLGGQGLVGPQ